MYDYLLKTLLIGDENVGKSTLLSSYNFNKLFLETNSTIGVDFFTTMIDWNKKKVKIQVWDCAGNHIYNNIVSSYYNSVVAALVVFDLANRESFKNVDKWISDFNRAKQKYSYVLLVGNYIDGTINVTNEEIRKKCSKYKIGYVEVNSSNINSIQKMFKQLVETILEENRLNPDWYKNNKGFNTNTNYTKFYSIDEEPANKCCNNCCVIM